MQVLAILGASGHGKVIAEAALLSGKWTEVVFFDDAYPSLKMLESWAVVGNTQDLIGQSNTFLGVVIAIGNNEIRVSKQAELLQHRCNIVSIIHPSAIISPSSKISCGSVVLAGAIINPFCIIGEACILNTGSTIDHDCQLSSGVHLSPGVNLAGGVLVGRASWLGIGSCVKQEISIGENVIVGAGAAVINDTPDNCTLVGVPAKPI
jgi:sugar O-acyltransferase (sialic acid O-acetyltransferase NeuD family)